MKVLVWVFMWFVKKVTALFLKKWLNPRRIKKTEFTEPRCVCSTECRNLAFMRKKPITQCNLAPIILWPHVRLLSLAEHVSKYFSETLHSGLFVIKSQYRIIVCLPAGRSAQISK